MKIVKDFVAIDFETLQKEATDGKKYNHLPIQLGMVKYVNVIPLEFMDTFINPPVEGSWKSYWKIGINSSDCEDAPSYADLHSKIIDFIKELPIIAFNASSELGAFSDVCNFYNLTLPFDKERFIDPYCQLLRDYECPIPPSNNMSGLERWVRSFNLWRDEWKAHRAIDDAIMTAELYLFLQTFNNIENILALKSVVKRIENPCMSRQRIALLKIVESERTDRLAGKTIVISGVFTRHSRDEYKEIIEKNGGKNVGSISKKTSFILAGDNMGPAKLEKANKLGVAILTEDEFLKLIE